MNIRLLPLLFWLPLAALAQTPDEYACDDGSRLGLSLSTAANGWPLASVQVDGEQLTLPQQTAASGSFYGNATIRLQITGDQLRITDDQDRTRRCSRQENRTATAVTAIVPAASSSFIDIGGSVSYRVLMPLPPNATLVIRVQDIVRPGAAARTLAEQRIAINGQQVPIPFSTTIDRDLVGKKSHIFVSARIEAAGKPLFVSAGSYPALSQGQARRQDIQLRQVSRGLAR